MKLRFVPQIKKYWWLLLLILFASYYAFYVPKDSTFKRHDTNFSISDTSNITRVEIHGSNSSITLEKSDTGWVCNRSKLAKKESIQLMLFALRNIKAKAPVPLLVADSLKSRMELDLNRIEVYSGRKKIQSFCIHYTETMDLQTVGKLKKSTSLFQLEVPSYGSELTQIFTSDPLYWEEIQRWFAFRGELFAIEVEVPSNPEKSFRIDLQNPTSPNLYALYFGKRIDNLNQDRLKRYLDALFDINVEMRVANLSANQVAEVNYTEPDFIVTLYNRSNKHATYRFIPIAIEEYIDELGRPVQFDLNRMYLTTSNDKNIYEIRFITFASVMKDITYFEPKMTN